MEPPPRTVRRDQARLQLRNDVRYDFHHIRIELVGQAASRMQLLHVDPPQLSYQTYLVQLRADRRLFRSLYLLACLPSHYDRSPLYPMGMACVNPPLSPPYSFSFSDPPGPKNPSSGSVDHSSGFCSWAGSILIALYNVVIKSTRCATRSISASNSGCSDQKVAI